MFLHRTYLWRKLRERKIVAHHKRVAKICEELIVQYRADNVHFEFHKKQPFSSEKIIWQYWAQGYNNVPKVVSECLASVEKYASDYTIIRLNDQNLTNYLDIPPFVLTKRSSFSTAFFSDLLRLMLLKTYGGVWLDATVLLTAPIPEQLLQYDFFVFRRNPEETHIKYWRNTYAYYFGWTKGFSVNMLSSIMLAKKNGKTISELCDIMLYWWERNTVLPDYFFLQILFDVYDGPKSFPLMSDCLPHYLQQSINDPSFNIMSREEILRTIPLHKLTYKTTP